MVSSGILHRLGLLRTDVSEELSASFIRATRIEELGTTLSVTINRSTLRRNTKSLGNIPQDAILYVILSACSHFHPHNPRLAFRMERYVLYRSRPFGLCVFLYLTGRAGIYVSGRFLNEALESPSALAFLENR
jgi:hypothetical protein